MECYLIGWMFLLECPRGPVWVHGYFWEGFHMWKFADDTTVSEVVPASKHSSLQQAADHIHDWSQQNHLQLNPTKCKEIRTYFKRTPPLLLSGVNRRGRVQKGIFNKIAHGSHKISHLLPTRSQQMYNLRSGRTCTAPVCKTNRFRDSFVISHCI